MGITIGYLNNIISQWQHVTNAEQQMRITEGQPTRVLPQRIGGVSVLLVQVPVHTMESVPFVKTVPKQLTDGIQSNLFSELL